MNIRILTAFSLLELLFTMCIAGIIMFISYDSLTSFKLQYRRREAQTELIKLKNIIEQQAINGAFVSVSGTTVPVKTIIDVANQLYTQTVANSQPITTPSNYYQIIVNDIVSTLPTGYTLIATPTSTSPQLKDVPCQKIKLTTTYDGSSANDIIKSPATCWGCNVNSDPTCSSS